MTRRTALLYGLTAAMMAWAPPMPGAQAPGAQVQATQGNSTSPCTCRNQGARVPVGGTACLQTPHGPRRARCVMQQNSPSWTISPESCPLV